MKRGVYRAFFVRVILMDIFIRTIKRQGRRSFRFILSDATNLITGFIFAFFVFVLLNIM